MKKLKRSTSCKFWPVLFLLTILSVGEILCRETPASEDSLAIVSRPFALIDIPSEFNALSNYLIEISKIIQADEKIVNNDLIVKEYTLRLEEDKQEILESLSSMTYQRLENKIRAWHNYKSKFDIIQETLKKRINEIESVKNELDIKLRKWKDISEELKQAELPEDPTQSTDTAVVALNVILEKASERSDTLLLVRSKQTQLNLVIDVNKALAKAGIAAPLPVQKIQIDQNDTKNSTDRF